MSKKFLGGSQDFAELREGGYFYVDKTAFIKDWWDGPDGSDKVTLITRPRRFGKTLMINTVEAFFSLKYAGRPDLFEGLEVWKDEKMRALQGTYPVISISWLDIKSDDLASLKGDIIQQLAEICADYEDLNTPEYLNSAERKKFSRINDEMPDSVAASSLELVCKMLYKKHGKKVIILLDEYDTPMQDALVNGFWLKIMKFLRKLFNITFKRNKYLERAILTGITRVSKESIFSGMNNLRVYGYNQEKYATYFGFTEEEVFTAMNEHGLTDTSGVKSMYDGYVFGNQHGIYNPWSIVCYLQEKKLNKFWANTSSNELANKLVREGNESLKLDFFNLLNGKAIRSEIDEEVVFTSLTGNSQAVWSLLLASGYLKPVEINGKTCTLELVNGEVRETFEDMIKAWFSDTLDYSDFVIALLKDDLQKMNKFINEVSSNCFSFFDTRKKGKARPELFYHGFVIGLLVDLRDRYILTSNRESGDGRYDVMLEPRNPGDLAYILEFKVHDSAQEADLLATAKSALAQIEEKHYEQELIARGIPSRLIRKYGFAFKGKKVLIA